VDNTLVQTSWGKEAFYSEGQRMIARDWLKVRVTEWIEDTDEKFVTGHGRITNREWLQREKKRIGRRRPYSRPFIGIHPKYFDKDSHGRRKHMLIALFQYVSSAERNGTSAGRVSTEALGSRKDRLQTAACAIS
jgi:hypothetical protein